MREFGRCARDEHVKYLSSDPPFLPELDLVIRGEISGLIEEIDVVEEERRSIDAEIDEKCAL